MRTIFTTEDIAVDGVLVLHINDLPRARAARVMAMRERLLRTATVAEKTAAKMLSSMPTRPTRQAYFFIRGRSYFLDFFFPERMVAVEIDGSSHLAKREYDMRRDRDFRSIGIRTIRIGNADVMSGRIYEKLLKRMF